MLNIKQPSTQLTIRTPNKKDTKELIQRGDPIKIINEDFTNHISFNVMPNLPVDEKLFIKQYRIWDRYIEATFDRQYHSSMSKSPDHLMFITILVHLQKMLYVYSCHEFKIAYEPLKHERVKIWPTVLNIKMPALITKTRNIVQWLEINDIFQRNEKSYYISAKTSIENTVTMSGETVVYLI